jgi:dTDP-4-amino-4,6-dideoxygalactose transaminase
MTLWPYHSEDEISAVADVLRSGKTNYWSGPNGQAFESEFAQYTGAKHALAVTNGTTALELALHGLDLPPWLGSDRAMPHIHGDGQRRRNGWVQACAGRH